jgi:hypothetical protein
MNSQYWKKNIERNNTDAKMYTISVKIDTNSFQERLKIKKTTVYIPSYPHYTNRVMT